MFPNKEICKSWKRAYSIMKISNHLKIISGCRILLFTTKEHILILNSIIVLGQPQIYQCFEEDFVLVLPVSLFSYTRLHIYSRDKFALMKRRYLNVTWL